MQQLYRPLFLSAILLLPAVAVAQVKVSVSPTSASLRAGIAKTFSASVSGTTNKSVTWAVNGIAGGNSAIGTINANGVYTSPAVIPAANIVRVRATSVAATTAFAESAVTLLNPEPTISSLTPNMVNVGTFTVTIKGRGFIRTSAVLIGDRPMQVQFVSDTELKATATETAPRETNIYVSNPNPGADLSNKPYFKIMPPITVNVSPDKYTLRLGVTKQYSASVGNAVDRTVSWHVNNVKGGNATWGTISETGLYTPPAVLPRGVDSTGSMAPVGTSPTVLIKAVSNADPRATESVSLLLQNGIPQILSATPPSLRIGQPVQVTINGTGFAQGLTALLGSSPLAITSFSPTRIVASGIASAMPGGLTTISVRNPDPGAAGSNSIVVQLSVNNPQLTAQQAARFLQRASWGPDSKSIARLQEMGIQAWLQEQHNAPVSDLPEPIAESSSISPAQRAFFLNAMNGPDQLRQRVAFALSQIAVVSGVKTGSSQQLVPYMRMMNRHAFGNYFALIKDVTLSPTMGRFLDMVNNRKLDPARGIEPNENYARELLQLFTVGLTNLTMDGQPAPGAPYSEATVKEYAKVFTGWTFATRPGEAPRFPNPSYYGAPMISFDEQHDRTSKTIMLGEVVPPGRTAAEEIDIVVENLRRHPNVPPFVALRLIQRLVMGNPSFAYIGRVASVFSQTHGDLWATTRAIVTDPEADVPQPQQGKLKEPALLILSYLRGLDAAVGIEHGLQNYSENMGQDIWFAPSVFNYFSPFFRVNGIVAPEFQVETPTVALYRVNFIYRASRNGLGSTVQIDLAHLERLASDPNALVEALNQALLYGSMSPAMRTSIVTALNATTDMRTRARNAAYLVGSSSQFQVEP